MQLIKETKEYRVDTEQEATDVINKFKEEQIANGYDVIKSGYTMKTKKAKGEIVDQWYIVSITMSYDIGE